MKNKYDNNHCVFHLSMIISIILSVFLHIFFVIFLINKVFFCIKIDQGTIKQNRNIIKLLPMNYINTTVVLQTECFSEILKNTTHAQLLPPNIGKTHKIVKNFNNVSNSVNNNFNTIDKNNIINVENHEFYKTNSIECNKDHNTSDINPNIIKYFHPKYPDSARSLGIEGELKIMYNINIMGKIEKIQILSSIPSGVFEENVKLAMRRWIYEKNKPIKNLIIVFKFSLNEIQLSVN